MRRDDGRLLHCWRAGQARFDAYLDDFEVDLLALAAELPFSRDGIRRMCLLPGLTLDQVGRLVNVFKADLDRDARRRDPPAADTAGGLIKKWCETKGIRVLTSTQVTGIERTDQQTDSLRRGIYNPSSPRPARDKKKLS